ncbi:FAD-dependent oxidoreductase [Pseudomonas orientalis]|jgi:glycine/D-amino acid oxidase-like deaminating enzyme|uniref:FAD-dependent oxidoreductase n=1 Tax=Pseudomonas TaxID=286 RepID=UPI00081202D8|nr:MULTISPECIES: FAD-dependent oxidoreductase [Pseudomonas]RZI24656.1 FAD-binding oxidoreductase [Pseudomonas orientalis]CRL98446.1 N-methyltryptophan oxidase [Pseudomonas sp. 28 E 9]
MSFDFCVLGNGPLGAAAAWFLSKEGAKVCLIGARPEERVCSHNDHSRIYRTLHVDPYWTSLAEANHTLMLDLQQRTDLDFFRPVPVYYDGGASPIERPERRYLTRNSFTHQDPNGGILDPLIYISALNQAAREQNTEIRTAVVTSTQFFKGGHDIQTSDGGSLRCKAVVDFRGLHVVPVGQGVTVARTTLLVRHRPIHESHCFIRTKLSDPQVAEFFACSHLDRDVRTQTSKFVIADAESIFLNDHERLRVWFQNDYRNHPKLPWAVEEIRRMGFEIEDLQLAPCAFIRTPNGRPKVEVHQNHLRFYGCNGSAVKCAQSLASQIITCHLLKSEFTS